MPSNELINVPTFFNFEIYQTPFLDKTRCHEKNTRISKSDNHWLHRNMRIYKTLYILKNLKIFAYIHNFYPVMRLAILLLYS